MSSPTGPWLVTGASGFLGRHLLEANERSDAPRRFVALVRDPAAWSAMPWTAGLTRVRTLTGELLDPAAWRDAPSLAGLAGIVHLAALVRHSRRDAELVLKTNVEGTLAMVDLAAARACRLVFVSSSGTVGCFRTPAKSADETAPYCEAEVQRWPYYRSKILAERAARNRAAEHGVDLVIVRPPVLLGPGDHRHRSTSYVARFLQNRIPFLIRGGMHFADVRDVAQALLRLTTLPRPRPIYHLPGTLCTLSEFYGRLARLTGKPAPRRVLPFRAAWWCAWLSERLGLGLLPEPGVIEMAAHHWAVRSLYAEQELGYASRPADLTLRDTIASLEELAQ